MGGMIEATPGVTHHRTLIYITKNVWEIQDLVSGQGQHTLEWYFHFAPDMDFPSSSNDHNFIELTNCSFAVIVQPPKGVLYERLQGWYSYKYSIKETAPLLKGVWHGNLSSQGLTFCWRIQLFPREDGLK
jgi:hypothetical protein